ncbi:T9SS-dependent M36 family metallopeptidase [Altibacter lentus]|uniref:T9SS-dependent M36 family metallopeptidase n=1 Tax=Altibacter lentus TaxID=1223410 RepID=UPI000557A787|nr:T9SS-dependent M36 family metallopeptidase [Altibacter lentus]
MKKLLHVVALLVVTLSVAQNFETQITSYLTANRAQLELQPEDIADVQITSNSFSKSMELENVYASQRHNGIAVYNSSSSFAIKNGQVIYAGVNFTSGLRQKVNTTTPSISPAAAILKAVAALGLSNPLNLELLGRDGNEYLFSNGGISLEAIPVTLVYQKTNDERLRLSWDLRIYLLDASHHYSMRIDAVTGTVLENNDWVISCNFGTAPHRHGSPVAVPLESILFKKESNVEFSVGGAQYRVFPLPLESPSHGSEQLVADPSNAVASPFGWHDTNGAPGAEYTITRGNNVWAQDDINNNNGTGASPDGGAGLNFDFPYDFNTAPVNMLDAVTTNLFYWNNIMHDVWYQYGFDEASGNFQENNYGNGGAGSDSVNADAQDGGGLNNANFSITVEGNNPRMQMYLWSASNYLELLTINNGPLAGGHVAVAANFGAAIPAAPLTQDLVLVEDDDAGASTDPTDACDTITNGAAINGKIAVIRRGGCEFGFKALAAETAGAIAVIVVNNEPGDAIVMGPGAQGGSVTIPAIMVSKSVGDAIIAELLSATVNGTIQDVPPGPQLDGDLDNGIIAHEYGHGISTRLTGGPANPACLFNEEQMGEGWSDYFGLVLTMEPGDAGTDIRGIGTYVNGQSTEGGGIREAPYSTDFAINDYTYADTNNNVSQPHGIGFVWATMLWDMTWDLIDVYGFDPDVYNGTGGNNIAMQLVIDGLKLQNCSPGFVNGRDAIIEADEITNGGANKCLIWNAFARRGCGFSASQGSSNNRTDQVEAFDLPAECSLGIEDLEGVQKNFVLYPNPSTGTINIASRRPAGDVTVSIFDLNGRTVFTQQLELQTTGTIQAEGLNAGMYLVTIEGQTGTQTEKLIIK